MKIHALFIAVALLLSGPAFAQPTPGLGCTPGTHTFCVTSTADTGAGSLRQAMLDSNSAGGANTIGFQIPGSGPQTIALTSQLPYITSNVTIDGYSQPGSALNTNAPDQGGLNAKLMIEINGSRITTVSAQAFYVTASVNVTLQGLAINGFGGDAVDGYPGGNGFGGGHTLGIYGCYIGTQLNGSAFAGGFGNNGAGIRTGGGSDDAQIGGTSPWQRNLISGNRSGAILTDALGATTIQGNLVGPDAGGTVTIGNSSGYTNWPAIYVEGTGAIVIGCNGTTACTAASRNVISGNHIIGVAISNGTATIKGNFIGTDWTGTQPMPNGDGTSSAGCPTYCSGIQLRNGTPQPTVIVGGFGPGEANLIAFNNGPGIVEWSGNFDNQANAIHNNRGPTNIALRQYLDSEPLANDAGDADSGNNNQQNYPVIASASVSGTRGNLTLNVTYSVDSLTSNSTYPLRIDFYVDIDEGSGEYLVSDSYAFSDATMPKTVSLPLPADVQSLTGIVVTATDANGYTSEFSPSWVFDRIFADRFEVPR